MGDLDRQRLRRFRLEKTNEVMKELNLEAIVATTFDNFRYIADIRPYYAYGYFVNVYVVVLTRNGTPIVQGPVVEGAPMGLSPPVKGWSGYPMIPIPLIAPRWASMVATLLRDNGVESGKVGVDDVSFITYLEISRALPRIEIVPVYEAMIEARAVKGSEELKLVRGAAELVDIGAKVGLEKTKAGLREREIVGPMVAAMYEAGSEAEPWPAILSSGERSLTSVFASDRVLKEGDLAIFDLGSIYEGYVGDIARTAVAGSPSREARIIYTAAYDAIMAGTKAVKPGALSSEVDAQIRRALIEAQCEVSPFATGHGVGVGAPEIPWITPHEEGIRDHKLKPGMIVCLEPRTSKGGLTAAGFEDMMLVTESGCEVLTKCTKQEHFLIR